MAHPEQRHFVSHVKNIWNHFFRGTKVLDVGSLNINGTLRDFFEENVDYTGIDVGSGPCVDIVCRGELFDAPNDTYDVVCSAECFEHNPEWLATFHNMIRMCKPGALLFFTCATTGRPEHGTTKSDPSSNPLMVFQAAEEFNYYRNLTQEDFISSIANFDEIFSKYEFIVNDHSHDLYFWGIKSCKQTKMVYKYFLK